jgi:hypothetical protein
MSTPAIASTSHQQDLPDRGYFSNTLSGFLKNAMLLNIISTPPVVSFNP